MTRNISLLILAIALLFGSAANAWFVDFENGLGMDQQEIGSSIPGLQFSAADGSGMRYRDATTGNYNVSNDLGDSWQFGIYNISGYVFASTGQGRVDGRIDFLNQDASYFTTGYCSNHPFLIEAYDAFDNRVGLAMGDANSQANGVYELQYLTVSSVSNNIAYVMLRRNAGSWLIDNMSGDASGVPGDDNTVPEPATLLLLGAGLAGVGMIRKRSK